MQEQEFEGKTDQWIVTGLIVNKDVLARLVLRWQKDPFHADWCNVVAQWCVDFYKKHKEPPRAAIVTLFKAWADSNPNPDTRKTMERFLSSLSKNYERLNEDIVPSHTVDMAMNRFNDIKLERLADDIGKRIKRGDTAGAIEAAENFRKVTSHTPKFIDVMRDKEAQRMALERKQNILVKYEGGLGDFFGSELSEDSLVSFLAPPKVGKSFWMLDIAWTAMSQKKKVAYFQVGDMTQDQVIRRLHRRATNRPIGAGLIRRPISLIPAVEGALAQVEFADETCEEHITAAEVEAAYEAIVKTHKHQRLRLSVHPSKSVSVNDIRAILEEWDKEGWRAQVVCLAEGSLVLTDRGMVPIEKIEGCDRLWDGNQWVAHGGAVCKGTKDVIEYQGVWATPDHMFWTKDGWRSLIACKRMGLHIEKTGMDGTPIRIGENNQTTGAGSGGISGESISREKEAKSLSIHEQNLLCVCGMCKVRLSEMDVLRESKSRNKQGMQILYAAKAVSHLVVSEDAGSQSKMHQYKTPVLEEIWGEGDSVSFLLSDGSMSICEGQSGNRSKSRNRQNRQRRSLRTGKFKTVYSEGELLSYIEICDWKNAQVSSCLSRCALCGQNTCATTTPVVPETNREKMEVHPEEVRQSKVWDIVNAGPNHRFTVQNVLAHNCIDYMDNLAPNNPKQRDLEQVEDTWTGASQIRETRKCCVVTATQTNKEGFTPWVLTKNNFSRNKMTLAIVTGMIGLNQTEQEQSLGLYRLNWIVRREGTWSVSKCCTVASCLDVAQAHVLSSF